MKSSTEDKESEIYALPTNQHFYKGKEDNITKEKTNTDQEGKDVTPVVSQVMSTYEVPGLTSRAGERQTLLSLSDTGQNTGEEDSKKHDAAHHSVMQPLLPMSNVDSADLRQDVERINEKGKEKKDEDGSDGEDLSSTDKYDSHIRKDSSLNNLRENNEDVTGIDLGSPEVSNNNNNSEEGSVKKWTLPKFNVTGIGLYVPMPPQFLRHLFSPLFSESRKAPQTEPQTER